MLPFAYMSWKKRKVIPQASKSWGKAAKMQMYVLFQGAFGLRDGESARQDKTRQDKTTLDKTRQDKTRQDKTRQDKTRQN